jgi:cytidylate kinase
MTAPTGDAPPLHGYRGDAVTPPPAARPRGLTVAVSREAGARGESIARRAGRDLGWQVFDADALDHLGRDEAAREELLADLPAAVREWAAAEAATAVRRRRLDPASAAGVAVRLMVALAARGEVVLVGRGAGFLLPAASTLHVRVVAPRAERVAYLADWLRLAPAEAAAELADRDAKRDRFLADVIGVADSADPCGYDLVLNSNRLGEEAAAAVIVQAVRHRHGRDE